MPTFEELNKDYNIKCAAMGDAHFRVKELNEFIQKTMGELKDINTQATEIKNNQPLSTEPVAGEPLSTEPVIGEDSQA